MGLDLTLVRMPTADTRCASAGGRNPTARGAPRRLPQRPPNVGSAPPRPTGPSPSPCRVRPRVRLARQQRQRRLRPDGCRWRATRRTTLPRATETGSGHDLTFLDVRIRRDGPESRRGRDCPWRGRAKIRALVSDAARGGVVCRRERPMAYAGYQDTRLRWRTPTLVSARCC